MIKIGKLCIFLLITLTLSMGCSKHPPSLVEAPSVLDTPLPPFSTPVTPEEVRLAFYNYSASAIVQKLTEKGGANWDMIMKKIAEGDAEWILYGYKYIKPGTDAGSSEEFSDVLSYALENNPEAVLSLDGVADSTLTRICGWPFIEPEWGFILRYGKKALAAVRKIDNPDLLESRDMCIRELEDGFAFMKKLYWEGRLRY